MRWSSQPRFHLEMALTRVLHARRLVPIEELINQLGGVGPPSSRGASCQSSSQLPQSSVDQPVYRSSSSQGAGRDSFCFLLPCELASVSR